MACAANQIRIGAKVEGHIGSRHFAGTVTGATSSTITVLEPGHGQREISPAWADDLVVDGEMTPKAGPMLTLHQLEQEKLRSEKNSAKTQNWLKRNKEIDPMMTKAEKKADLLKKRAEALKKPVQCEMCGNDYARTGVTQRYCPACGIVHKYNAAKERAQKYRLAKKAALGAPSPSSAPEKGKTGVPPVVLPATGETPVLRKPEPPPAKPIANETCKTCGDYYFPGVTGVRGECNKCFEIRKAKNNQERLTREGTEKAETPRGMILVPAKALEVAHGQIQKLWAEIARLQAELAAAKGA